MTASQGRRASDRLHHRSRLGSQGQGLQRISDIFLLVVHVVYQVLLVADLEIDPFAIAGKIEYVFVFCLGVHEVSGFLLADTSAIGSDEVTVYVIGYRQKLGTSDIYDLLADHKMYSKGIVLN